MSETQVFQLSLAVIADIHGNRWALEAVLQDIDRRGIQQIVNLGDHLTGPLDPAGTADLLIERDMLSICGNDDRVLFSAAEELSSSQRYTQEHLTAERTHLSEPFSYWTVNALIIPSSTWDTPVTSGTKQRAT